MYSVYNLLCSSGVCLRLICLVKVRRNGSIYYRTFHSRGLVTIRPFKKQCIFCCHRVTIKLLHRFYVNEEISIFGLKTQQTQLEDDVGCYFRDSNKFHPLFALESKIMTWSHFFLKEWFLWSFLIYSTFLSCWKN